MKYIYYITLFLLIIGCNDTSSSKSENKYSNGPQETLFVDYYDNGKVRIEGKMTDGLKDGRWKEYKENGEIQKTEYYFLGSLEQTLNNLDFDFERVVMSDGSSILLPKDWRIETLNLKYPDLIIAVQTDVSEQTTFKPSINVNSLQIGRVNV